MLLVAQQNHGEVKGYGFYFNLSAMTLLFPTRSALTQILTTVSVLLEFYKLDFGIQPQKNLDIDQDSR